METLKDVNGKEILPGDIVGEYPEGTYWEYVESMLGPLVFDGYLYAMLSKDMFEDFMVFSPADNVIIPCKIKT